MSSIDMDSTAIAMMERVRIEDNVASAMLNAASGSGLGESGGDNAQDSPSDVELDIFAAAQQGKTERIRALIESGRARATDKDGDNITSLHWAAINGHTEACTYLIEQGAEVNAVGGELRASPLQWAARNGLARTIDLLLRHGANPRLLDAQGYSCLHSVTHSSNYWAFLYVLCRPEVAIDEPDSAGHTALHWAVYQRDEVSAGILLKLGADPNIVDGDGLTPLHWAAFTGNKKCITLLLEAGADIRAMNRDRRTAEEMASEFRNGQTWKEVVDELGFKSDGTRVRRPLSELSVYIIVFSVPSISLCIAFTVAGVFPWFMSIFLSPATYYVMNKIVTDELLQRNSVKDSLNKSPYFFGVTFGTWLWVAYAWITRLRYDFDSYPFVHAAFLCSFALFVLALLCIAFCDPGMCVTPTKDALKSITEDLVRSNRLTTEAFCVRCLVVKVPHTTHCPTCKRCITRHKISAYHAPWVLNCIGKKNHVYFIVFMMSLVAGALIFDYLVWIHLLTLKNSPIPGRFCFLPHAVCNVMSADMFLISIAIWSTLNLVLMVVTMMYYVVETCKLLKRGLTKVFRAVVVHIA